MIVVIAGMPRSGSTLTYNIAREFLITHHIVEPVLSNSLPQDFGSLLGEKNSILLKSHAPDPLITDLVASGHAHCICSIRKPEDAIASWMNTFGFSFEESIQHFETWLVWHSKISKHALNINFHEIENNLVETIETIGFYLNGDTSPNAILSISEKYRKDAIYKRYNQLTTSSENNIIDCGFSIYDRDTLFHRRHVSSLISKVGNELLHKDQLETINYRLGQFLDGDGNYNWRQT